MARRTPQPAAATTAVLDVAVKFGSVSIRKTIAHIGCTAQRKDMSIKDAEKRLCMQRLIGRIEMRPDSENRDQARLGGMDADILRGSFDSKTFTISGDEIKFGLSFPKRGIDFGVLSLFSSQTGRLVVEQIEKIVEGDKTAPAAETNGDDDAGDEDEPSDDDFEE